MAELKSFCQKNNLDRTLVTTLDIEEINGSAKITGAKLPSYAAWKF